MAEIKTVVSLNRKEVDDCLIELAKKQLDKCVGSASITYDLGETLNGVTVTFTGKVRT